ncbi:MAG TPA: portal protein [Isosphaeraceae bacterium]|nr:portal protein [Isosphaeraceae bacterium]
MANEESVWRRLTRLFRSGPVVRHKIAGGEKLVQPQGTAKAFKKELSSLYVRALASYANYERLSRYSDYNEMEYTPELHGALDIYADEATVKNDEGHCIEITSRNAEIKEILETLFFDVIDIDFNAWSWMRHFCKFGDFVLFVDANEQNGILNLVPIPINEIEREEGYDAKDPMAVRFRWLTRGNTILENWQVIHFRMLGNDAYLPYGSSVLEPARRIWRQLILIEDAMLVYRIVRSPERRVFHIEIANTPPDQVDAFIEQVKTQMKRNTIVDPETGRVDLRYNPLSVEEDYFLPKRGEQKSQIDTLAGGQFTGDIEDVQYIQSKMFAAIKIPRAYLGYEDQLGSKATLAQEDVRFSKTIERIQGLFVAELNKIAIIHLYLLGYSGADLANFNISMANPSTVAAQQRLELWRMKLEVAGMAQEGVFDRGFIYRKIFGLNDKQIAAIKDGKRIDKLEDTLLQSIETPPAAEAPPGPEPAPEEPGAEELPNTLGGPEPGGPPPEAPPPQNASRSLAGAILGEKFNPGSTGNRAEIAVDKGKNLFSTGENPLKLSFGTKKQTASDPNDRRAARRVITRPFSEESEPEMPGAAAIDEVQEMLEQIGSYLNRRGRV